MRAVFSRGYLAIIAGAGASLLVATTPIFAAQTPPRASDPMMQVPAVQISLSRLPEWSQTESRHRSQVQSGSAGWQAAVAGVGQDGTDLLTAANSYVNRARYVSDRDNWGSADHWATPTDLFERGGDCEDYAIAKYMLLREAGVPSSQMRILILRAANGIPEHSVLIVQTSSGIFVLDNLRPRPYAYTQRTASAVTYAFNEDSMWMSLAGL
jgi:predicted transglutaminase-like cysteine proteinase